MHKTYMKNPIHDYRLSPECLGVLMWLRCGNTPVTTRERFSLGRHKYNRIIKDLIATGWIKKVSKPNNTGQFQRVEIVMIDEVVI